LKPYQKPSALQAKTVNVSKPIEIAANKKYFIRFFDALSRIFLKVFV
jgi:hypothetical protein